MRFVFDLIDCGNSELPIANSDTLSVVCITATNPVYLVFTDNRESPTFVVKTTRSTNVNHVYERTRTLHNLVGDLIAKPISLGNFQGCNYIVESGLPGKPWFNLGQLTSNYDGWERIRKSAMQSLTALHRAIKDNPEWTLRCHPGEELRQRFLECLKMGIEFSTDVPRQVEILAKHLDRLDSFTAHFQHGDYCLNNLLFEESDVHIIDFEDFGLTVMPMHDEFSLALSLLEKQGISMGDELSRFEPIGDYPKKHDNFILSGLFLHHLLLRLGKWSEGERRKEFRGWLLELANQFCQNPDAYFKNIGRA